MSADKFQWVAPSELPGTPARAILHWTAGVYVASGLDRQHYHMLVEWPKGASYPHMVQGVPLANNLRDIRRGDPTFSDGDPNGYAAHTWGLNSWSLGAAICAMYGAQNRNNVGAYPILPEQVDVLIGWCAHACGLFGWEPTEDRIYTHYEAHTIHGVPQNGDRDISKPPWKWDITVIPGEDLGPDDVGPWLRARVAERLVSRP